MVLHHISQRQLIWLTAVGIIAAGLFTVPRVASDVVGTGAWLIVLVNGVLTVGPALAIVAVGQRFPGRIAADYLETLLGKWLGKLVTLLVLLAFALHIIFTSHLFLDIVSWLILPFTPLEACTGIFFIVVAYMAAQRLEIIARGVELAVPVAVLLFVLLLGRAIRNVDLLNLQPVFHMHGSFIKGLQHDINVFFGGHTLWVTVASLRLPKGAYKSSVVGIALATVIYLSITMVTLGILGIERIADYAWPSLEAIRTSVALANVTGPPGLVLTVVWTSIVFFSTALHIHAASITGLRLFGLPSSYRSVAAVVLCVIMGGLVAKLFPNRLAFFEASQAATSVGLGLLYVMPLLIWFIALIRRQHKAVA